MAPKAAQTSAPHALLIKKQWCQKIFRGSKTWEIRGERCHRRGKIYVAQCGASQLVGEVDVVDCLPVGAMRRGRLVPASGSEADRANFIGDPANRDKHCIHDLSLVQYPKVYAWVLANKVAYDPPKPFRQKRGCVKWQKLELSDLAG